MVALPSVHSKTSTPLCTFTFALRNRDTVRFLFFFLREQDGYGAVVSNEPGQSACGQGLVVVGSRFTTNEGGGLAAFNGDLVVHESTFTGNRGTAVYFETSEAGAEYVLEVLERTLPPSSSL